MIDYRQQIDPAIQAVVIHSPTSFSWFGKPSERLAPAVRRALTPTTGRSFLIYQLQTRLYEDFYCSGVAAPSRPERSEIPVSGRTPFVEALSEANTGGGCWEDGWIVRAVTADEVAVTHGGLTVRARPADCATADGAPPAPGLAVRLRFPKELLGISPGFYMALGDEQPGEEAGGIVRLYWHLDQVSAIPFVREATTALNRAGVPFKLKVLNDPARFDRCDAGVLYANRCDSGAVAATLGRVYRTLAGDLAPGTPAFTRPLAPGVGFAEDPGGEESFGQHRCRLLAEGLVRAHERGERSPDGRWRVVAECFAEDGLRPDRPFLNAASGADGDALEAALARFGGG